MIRCTLLALLLVSCSGIKGYSSKNGIDSPPPVEVATWTPERPGPHPLLEGIADPRRRAAQESVAVRVEMMDGRTLDLTDAMTVNGVAQIRFGMLILRLYQMDVAQSGPGARLWGCEIECPGKNCWESPADWAVFRRWTVGMPSTWAPTYHPYDGTIPVGHSGGYTAWEVLGDQHPRAVHARAVPAAQPSSGHGVEGRGILRVIFGTRGVDVSRSVVGDSKLTTFLGGGLGDAGLPGLTDLIRLWEWTPTSSNLMHRPYDAGTWWLAAHDIYYYSVPPYARPFGVQRLGMTPGADGPSAGENGRYWGALWSLGARRPGGSLLGLTIARHVASVGWMHEGDADNYHSAYMTGMRRFEKCAGDFPGDYYLAHISHNWTSDIQFASACFPDDPLLRRTAEEARAKLLRVDRPWQRIYGGRLLDRWLEGLRAAYIITGDVRYRNHAGRVLDLALAQIPPGEDWLADVSNGPGTSAAVPWQDMGALGRIVDLFGDGIGLQHQGRIETICRWYLNNGVRADGVTSYYGTYSDASDQWSWQYPSWARGALPMWWIRPMHWLGLRDATLRPRIKQIIHGYSSLFTSPLGSSGFVDGNISAKTRGQQMLGTVGGGEPLREILTW